MIAIDSSVAIAAFATWHEAHSSALEVLARRPQLAAHSAVETFSVLTRLPPPHRVPHTIVAHYLDDMFPPSDRLVTRPRTMRDLPRIASDAGISGGRVHDALIGITARDAGAALVTRDVRAEPTYRALGVTVELMA